ncbi:hypothetical protein MNBD_ALPHA06-1711 [hydrothermal vent metagenome]|uniref:Uncharacterized protein n=1 Tax=hydrothermal vent metagenome TaxID=652676 RepID=A0A3B0SKW9_9ZZZZ
MSGLADIKDVIRGALASFFGFGGRLFARVIFILLAARIYGVEALGILGQIAAISEIAVAIGVLGLKRSLLDMLSEKVENGENVETRVVEALLFSLGFGLLISGFLLLLWPLILPDDPQIWALLFFAVPASIVAEVALTAIKFKRIVRWDVWARSIGEPWGILALAAVFIIFEQLDSGLLIAYAGSLYVVAAISSVGLLHAYGVASLANARPSLATLIRIPMQSAPVGITDIGVMALRRIDLIIMSIFVGPSGTGLYYMVQQLATIQQRLGSLFEPMLSPVIARLHNQMAAARIRAFLVGICRWIFIIQLAIVVPLLVFGDTVLAVFNPAFSGGLLVLSIVLLAELIDGSFISVETPLVFATPKIPPLLLLLTLLIEVFAIAVLSKFWGVQGAAIGFFIAVAFLNLGRLFSLSKYLNIRVVNASYLLPLVLAILMLVALYALRSFMPPEQGVFVGIGILFSLIIFGFLIKTFALTKADKILLRVLKRKKQKSRS